MPTLRMSSGIPAWCPLEKKAAKPRSHRYPQRILVNSYDDERANTERDPDKLRLRPQV
jgi:hypothetical protein